MKKTILIFYLFLVILFKLVYADELYFLHTRDTRIVNEQNEEVYLYGFNLGNWLLVEPWMLKFSSLPGIEAGADIFNIFEKRFGIDKAKEIYKTYMDNYITEYDIKYLASLGVNFLRIPFWYRAVVDKKYTPEEMYYLDRVIGWCRKYKIYCLIDMHGAPGGQSDWSGILGERMNNQLWNNEGYLNETIELWKKIARKYKDEKAVAG